MNTINWELLINYINGDCTDLEIKQVLHWSAEQPENRYLLTYLKRRQAQLLQPIKQSDIDEQWLHLLSRMYPLNQQPNNKHTFFNQRWFIGIAASFLLVSIFGWFYYNLKTTGNTLQTVQTNANTRSKVALPDGSLVYLAPNSTLSFKAFGNEKREINLNGEAFFDVKHIENKPFIISTGQHLSVTVLGTSFNVYARQHMPAEVMVATGRVGVVSYNHTYYLKAGQQLTRQTPNNQILIKPVIIKEASALQNGTLVFHNNNAEEIAQKIQRWYNVKVKVLPTASKAPRFSGEMKDTGIADLLNGLSYATGLHYRFENSKTLVLF